MWTGLRVVLVIALLGLLGNAPPAWAADRRDCAQLTDLDIEALPQAVYLPPLVEDASYSITNPGQLVETHLVALRELLDRARCIAQARHWPLATLRLSVYARTDDRGAREHILAELRRRGVNGAQLNAMGRSVVDVVAAWHRARVLVDHLREEVSRDLRADPSLGSIDPVGMVQPGDLISEEPANLRRIYGAPPHAHPRSFVMVIAARENLPANLATAASPLATPAAAASLALPPIIQVSCCDTCSGKHRHIDADAEDSRSSRSAPWLGTPQLDVLIGAAIATDAYTRDYLYRELAWLGVGVRLPLRRLELGVRLSFHAGGHPVTFNHMAQDQLRLGGGATLQFGVLALQHDRVRLAIGADIGWVYLFRRIERIDFPHQGVVDTKHVYAPQAGGWLRLNIPVPRIPRLAFAAELSLGVIPFSTEDNAPANLTAKALGGFTYALR